MVTLCENIFAQNAGKHVSKRCTFFLWTKAFTPLYKSSEKLNPTYETSRELLKIRSNFNKPIKVLAAVFSLYE